MKWREFGVPGVLGELEASSRVVVDRPKGSAHPRFPEIIYPLDDGFLEGTTSGDGQGIDMWLGSGDPHQVNAILCATDLKKRDAELKMLLGCTSAEAHTIASFTRTHTAFQDLLVPCP
ncbi:inorganic pyrophosphatase [Deinococcus sp. UYEF24]